MSLYFDTVVLGGGIVGASIAAALTELGIEVLLLESGTIGGQGASRYSGGIVRNYDPDEKLQELSLYSRKMMSELVSGKIFWSTVKQTGVFMSGLPESFAKTINDAEDVLGHKGEIVSRAKAQEMGAHLNPNGGSSVLYERESGFGNVKLTCKKLAQFVSEHGAVLENARTTVEELGAAETRIFVGDQAVTTKQLVIAAGCWATELIPGMRVVSKSIPMVRMYVDAEFPAPLIDFSKNAHLVPAGSNFVHVSSQIRSEAKSPAALKFDHGKIIEDAKNRFSALTDGQVNSIIIDVIEGYDGYLEQRPFFGPLDGLNIHAACGFAGIGYKLAVGCGWLIAKSIKARIFGGKLSQKEEQLLDNFALQCAERAGEPT